MSVRITRGVPTWRATIRPVGPAPDCRLGPIVARGSIPSPATNLTGRSAAWLARLLWEQQAAGSIPAAPTNHST